MAAHVTRQVSPRMGLALHAPSAMDLKAGGRMLTCLAIDAERLVRNDPTWLVRPSRCRTNPSSAKPQAAPRNSRRSNRQWAGPSLNPVAQAGSRRGRCPKPDPVFADGRAFLD